MSPTYGNRTHVISLDKIFVRGHGRKVAFLHQRRLFHTFSLELQWASCHGVKIKIDGSTVAVLVLFCWCQTASATTVIPMSYGCIRRRLSQVHSTKADATRTAKRVVSLFSRNINGARCLRELDQKVSLEQVLLSLVWVGYQEYIS